jgi:cation transport ATPase
MESTMKKAGPTQTRTGGATRKQAVIAAFALAAIGLSLVMRFAVGTTTEVYRIPLHQFPLIATLLLGGVPLVFELLTKLLRREFGSDLLAGISIVTSALLGEYLAGSLVVLMLSGGEALEAYAVRSASAVLEALARRMPSLAHRRKDGQVVDVALALVASLERYSKHPLRAAVLEAARGQGMPLQDASEVREPPGEGLRGTVAGRSIQVTSRKQLATQRPQLEKEIPPFVAGMECVIAIDGRYAATFRFRDQPRAEGASFVRHLRPSHFFDRVLIVSGDRESEVRYLAEQVGIQEVYASQTPEQKVEIVRQETRRANTVFLGDGINDAPALTAATVGIAFGQHSDITAEAAGAVILDTSLAKVDEFLHISRRLRAILLQSAIGGMALSLLGIGIAAAGYLPPVAGAILQEVIDVVAVVNALRVAFPPKKLTDFSQPPAPRLNQAAHPERI